MAEEDGPSVHASPRRAVPDAAALAGLLVVLAFLWGRGRTVWYWLDEGLSVGFSSHPLGAIPGLLRQDGSPPLYYWLLHGWMALVGRSEGATHLLSLVFGLATVGAAWWAGRTLFDRRTAWILVALAAISPFLAFYSNETRMYTLVVFLAMVATASFLHAFVFRRRKYLVPFAVALALLLYTHNWGLLWAGGAAVALVPCLVTADDRKRLVVDAVLAFGAVGVVYLPWLPTLLYQARRTGAPWSPRPTLELVREDVGTLVGGPEAVVAFGLGAGVALARMFRRPWTRTSILVIAALTIVVLPIGAAYAVSRDSSIWAYRYLGVVLPALLVVLALALRRGGELAMAALGVVALLSGPIDVKTPPQVKSNLKAVVAEVAPSMTTGDLVISPDYGEVPLLAYYLPPGMRYADTDGLVVDPTLADQRDATERLRTVDVAATLRPVVDSVAVGNHVLFVCPPPSSFNADDPPFVHLIADRCQDTYQLLTGDDRFKVEASVDGSALTVNNTPVSGYLFTRVR